jgi:hypothetical protein
MLPWQIQFGLFPFRSPLLGKSLLIFFPRGTQMLHFPRFDLYYLCSRVCLTHRIPIRRSQDQRSHAPTLSLSQLATSFISSQAKPSFNWRRHISIFSHILHDYTRRSSLAPGLGCQLRPSPDNFLPSCILLKKCASTQFRSFLRR